MNASSDPSFSDRSAQEQPEILIIEDNEYVGEMLRLFLTKVGFSVELQSTLHSLTDLARQSAGRSWRVVLADLSAVESIALLTNTLKLLGFNGSVIAHSGSAALLDVNAGEGMVSKVLQKPCSRADLLAAITPFFPHKSLKTHGK